jgi:hypothetical protein
MFRDKLIAAARTGFAAFGAFVVTWVVSLLGSWGFEVTLDPEWATLISGILFAAFVGCYNLGVAWLTDNVWDGFGWLLGVNKPPSYVEADLRTEPAEDAGLALDSDAIRADTDPHRT